MSADRDGSHPRSGYEELGGDVDGDKASAESWRDPRTILNGLDGSGPAAQSARASEDTRLEQSVYRLHRSAPGMSALRLLSLGQIVALVIGVATMVCLALISLLLTLQLLVGAATLIYSASLLYRMVLVHRGMRGDHLVHIDEVEARQLADDDLPVYTVLVPAYQEPQLIEKIITALRRLDYPSDKLDIRLLLESDDVETIARARSSAVDGGFRIVLVPPGGPRTKPKACNYGLLDAVGEYVTIFDVEDRPEPLQLRRAVVALRRLGPGFACVQARLSFYNWRQNLLTRWFEIEYGTWFRMLLPGLVASRSPIPLGGTSNHFRTDVLRAVGAWDPHNVTEDADLGVRLARLGYSVGVLDSTTLEEANSDFVNWAKQRSRWYKGYFVTWLVHTRHPIRLHREIGGRGVLGLHLFILATPLTSLLNPIFWALTVVWFARHPQGVADLFPPIIFYPALVCMLLGNLAVIYMNVLAVRVLQRPELLWAAVSSPVYWLMMGVAAIKAAYQLVVHSTFWEKTTHGLDEQQENQTSAAVSQSAATI